MEEIAMADTYQVRPGDFQTAGEAAASIKRKLKQLGINSAILRRISVACYEAELNLIIHSLGGTLTMEMTPAQLRLLSRDIGPGIADVGKAMQEGYSTAPDNIRALGFGAGMGLPNMKRYTDSMQIESEVGKGTKVTMQVMVP